MKSRLGLISLVGAVLLLGASTGSRAQVLLTTPPPGQSGWTLAQLQDLGPRGGIAGDKLFTNWVVSAFATSNGISSGFNPSQININFVPTVDGVDLIYNNGFSLSRVGIGTATANITFGYTVTALGGLIDAVDANGGWFPSVPTTGNALDGVNASFGDTLTGAVHEYDLTEQGSADGLNGTTSSFGPLLVKVSPFEKSLVVVKDFNMVASVVSLAPNGGDTLTVESHVSNYKQSFHEVPAPAAPVVALIGTGVFGAMFRRRRR